MTSRRSSAESRGSSLIGRRDGAVLPGVDVRQRHLGALRRRWSTSAAPSRCTAISTIPPASAMRRSPETSRRGPRGRSARRSADERSADERRPGCQPRRRRASPAITASGSSESARTSSSRCATSPLGREAERPDQHAGDRAEHAPAGGRTRSETTSTAAPRRCRAGSAGIVWPHTRRRASSASRGSRVEADSAASAPPRPIQIRAVDERRCRRPA